MAGPYSSPARAIATGTRLWSFARSSFSASQARNTPRSDTGRDGRSSVIGRSTAPYIQVSSAKMRRAPAASAPASVASVIVGNSRRQSRNGGIAQR
jgi:hypothetical protein